MKAIYKRENLIITAFDAEDVITTSGDIPTPTPPVTLKREIENVYRTFGSLNDAPSSWF